MVERRLNRASNLRRLANLGQLEFGTPKLHPVVCSPFLLSTSTVVWTSLTVVLIAALDRSTAFLSEELFQYIATVITYSLLFFCFQSFQNRTKVVEDHFRTCRDQILGLIHENTGLLSNLHTSQAQNRDLNSSNETLLVNTRTVLRFVRFSKANTMTLYAVTENSNWITPPP
jgi:hypothetical protein